MNVISTPLIGTSSHVIVRGKVSEIFEILKVLADVRMSLGGGF